MYQYYYSSSDVQIYLTSRDHTKQIRVDAALTVAYNLFQTSNPIYSLGNRKAQFYSMGNTVANGILSVAFQDEEALKYALDYINSDSTSSTYTSARLGHKMSNAEFKNSSKAQRNASSFDVTGNKRLISIGAIQPLFHIKLYFNNETAIRGSDTKVICLSDVKFVGEGMQIGSSQDASLSVVYRFNFKDTERG